MRIETMLDLIEKWERDPNDNQAEDGSPEAAVGNAKKHGIQCGRSDCARELRVLINLME